VTAVSLVAIATVAILATDAMLWEMEREMMLSKLLRWSFEEWPVLAAVCLLWLGILIGCFMP
jgi:hypothetical protein